MFLFLSKLLPLFVYPLGFACLLLVGAIAVFWKRPQIAGISIALALSVLLLSSNYWIARGLVRSLEWQNIPASDFPRAAAIVVLGGATKSALYPRPWVDLSEEGDRVLYGAQLYRAGKAPLVILSGGRIAWRGRGAPESADMAEVIQTMGVPASAILQDSTSLNTYENGVNVRKVLKDKSIQGPILLVTSAMHMPRSMAIFKHLGMKAIAAPTDFQITEPDEDQGVLAFLLNLLPDVDNLQRSTKALKEYLGLITYYLRGWL